MYKIRYCGEWDEERTAPRHQPPDSELWLTEAPDRAISLERPDIRYSCKNVRSGDDDGSHGRVRVPRGEQPSLSQFVQTLWLVTGASLPAGHAGLSGLHWASALAEPTDVGDHWRVIRTATIMDGRTQRARRASHVPWPIGSDRIWHFGQHRPGIHDNPRRHPATTPPPRPHRSRWYSVHPGLTAGLDRVLVPMYARFRLSDPVSIDKDRGSPLAASVGGWEGNRLECGFSRGSVIVIP